jgi:2-polyprenyl-3-methyl-5-hydroxy-6-metoxy-1,4-benzoquinol methylase
MSKNEEKGYFSNERKEMIQFIPVDCEKILEIGCSEGSFGQLLKTTRDIELWGVEKESSAATRAKGKLDFVIEGDFLEIEKSLPKKYFDCIVLNDVLEHFIDPWDLLLRAKSLLKVGGYIVSSIPNFRYVGNLYELLVMKDLEYKASGILDITHFRFYTERSIIRLFTTSGYSIVRIQGINPTMSVKVKFAAWLSFGFLKDIKYLEFAFIVRLL